METYKVKFFGAKEDKGKLVQTKTEVTCEDRSKVEDALRKLGYKRINGLKIR